MSAEPAQRDPDRGSEQATVTGVRVAAAAADAARATAGVVRLQPGVWGLVRRLSQEVWERATGQEYPDTGGVEATLDGDRVRIDLTVVTDARAQAAAVVRALQQAVSEAVTDATGLLVSVVSVHVTDIDLYGAAHSDGRAL